MYAAIDLLPHRSPFLLVDRVLSVESDEVRAEKRVTAGDPLLGDAGLGGPLLVEALAQTCACLMGAQHLAAGGGGRHLGYLVAAQAWKFSDFARPGETALLFARRQSSRGALHRFTASARVASRPLAEGIMTFAVEFIAAGR